jgi:hypothetical protein
VAIAASAIPPRIGVPPRPRLAVVNATAVAPAAARPAPIAASVAGTTCSWIGESAAAGSP